MYNLEDYYHERIAVVVADEEEYRWFTAQCAERNYNVAKPSWYPASLSGWDTWDDIGYYTDKYGIPEVTLCELQEYIYDVDGQYAFSEDEFLSMIGG